MDYELEVQRLNLYISYLNDDIENLKAKVKRLQQSKLDKFTMAAMSGFCTNPRYDCQEYPYDEMAQLAIKQAKSLLDALEMEGKGEDA